MVLGCKRQLTQWYLPTKMLPSKRLCMPFPGLSMGHQQGKVLLVPAIPDVIGNIDTENGTMTITPLAGLFDI